MHTRRSAALAIVLGSLAGLLTMVLHPTGTDVTRDASQGAANILAPAVHWLAIVSQAFVLAGTLGLVRRMRARVDIAVGAWVAFALASMAVIIAAVASGFIAPAALRGLDAADAAGRAEMIAALHYTRLLNQAFAAVYVALGGVAIGLWSIAIVAERTFSKGLGVFGIALGAAMLFGVITGHLHLGIHGFGAVVLGVAVWMLWAAARLSNDTATGADDHV